MPWDLMGFTIQNLSIFQIHSAANLMGSETRIFFPFAICNTVLYTVAGKISYDGGENLQLHIFLTVGRSHIKYSLLY
jgi:ABC-type uncharacterized transport system permease subunit